MLKLFLSFCLTLTLFPCAQSAAASEDAEAIYVEANLLSIFYHELGHALVDILQLPVFGQEEDAADTASILLIDALYDEDAAQELATFAAYGFLDEASAGPEEPAWWGTHGHDLQRYYNLVCLFYGADPDSRETLAEDLELPEERAETCPEEFELANESWGPVFDEVFVTSGTDSIQFSFQEPSVLSDLIADEVAALNSEMTLPQPLIVTVTSCGEPNGFYDLEAKEVIMCSELVSHLREIRPQN